MIVAGAVIDLVVVDAERCGVDVDADGETWVGVEVLESEDPTYKRTQAS